MRKKYTLTERDLTTPWKGDGLLEPLTQRDNLQVMQMRVQILFKKQNQRTPSSVVFLAESAVAGGGRSRQLGPTPALRDGESQPKTAPPISGSLSPLVDRQSISPQIL